MDPVEVIMHPVRVRILRAFAGDVGLTTAQLQQRLVGDSQATVYRHVHALAEAGVLVVVGDRKVRGTVERTYRLNRSLVSMDSETAATMSRDDHRRAFTAATAALLADFEAYISQSHADPLRDSVSYRQIPVWLSDEERLELVNGFQALIDDAMRQEPSKDRRGYLLSPIFFPMIGDD